jgi:hypothetical protein
MAFSRAAALNVLTVHAAGDLVLFTQKNPAFTPMQDGWAVDPSVVVPVRLSAGRGDGLKRGRAAAIRWRVWGGAACHS